MFYDCIIQMNSTSRVNKQWQTKAKQIIKVELLRQDISYEQLSKLMKTTGVIYTPGNLKTKINRGTFSAAFLLQVLEVIGSQFSIE